MKNHTVMLLALAGCASAPAPSAKGGPRGLHANEHLDLARQHEEAARASWRWPDTRVAPGTVQMPWVRSWDAGAEHERAGAAHRGRAAEIQAEYDEACGARPLDQVSTSPLQRYAVGGWDTSTGVIMYLSADAGMPDQLLADMRCHRAWMMLAPAGMEDCPLDLPGILVDARGDKEGIIVSIVTRNAALVEELHRRAAHELETSLRLRHSPKEE